MGPRCGIVYLWPSEVMVWEAVVSQVSGRTNSHLLASVKGSVRFVNQRGCDWIQAYI